MTMLALVGTVAHLVGNSILGVSALGPVELTAAAALFLYGVAGVAVVHTLNAPHETAAIPAPVAEEHGFKRAA